MLDDSRCYLGGDCFVPTVPGSLAVIIAVSQVVVTLQIKKVSKAAKA